MEQEQSRITTEYGIDLTFVTFEDEKILEEAQIRELQKEIEPVIDKNKDNQLVLNFANVRFMTSAMLGLLVRIHKRVGERGGELELRNLDKNLQKLFDIKNQRRQQQRIDFKTARNTIQILEEQTAAIKADLARPPHKLLQLYDQEPGKNQVYAIKEKLIQELERKQELINKLKSLIQ